MEKILVINNDMDTMTLLKELLEKKSYSVKYTSSGEDGMHLAEKFNPDLVLVDVLQKDCITGLKTHPATALIPILMMTGYTWNNEQGNETGADEVIEKPFYIDQLEEKIQSTLTRRVQ
jgi:DNA-binding response OmpR family regulator